MKTAEILCRSYYSIELTLVKFSSNSKPRALEMKFPTYIILFDHIMIADDDFIENYVEIIITAIKQSYYAYNNHQRRQKKAILHEL